VTFAQPGFLGPKSGQVFPPLASVNSVPQQFDSSYEGSREMERRVRAAITTYALQTVGFWRSSVLLFLLGVVVAAAVLRSEWNYYPIAAILVVLIAASVPLSELLDIRNVAKTYAFPRVRYAAAFSERTIVWQTMTGTFEIAWDSVSKVVRRERVVVLTLENSRAIAVLPYELLTKDGQARLEELDRRLHAE
jgi:YcxB-like protein